MLPPGVEVRPVQAVDIDHLGARMREADRVEMRLLGHNDMRQVVAESMEASELTAAVDVQGELACLLGLARAGTHLAPIGVPWMLGTPVLARNARSLMRVSPPYIAAMLARYDTLQNVVHAGNTVSIRWLRHLGATFQALPGSELQLFTIKRHV